ncbi:hypothetical protein IAD21_02111 [Abditibacteriota bacterium]|nr:hypothetical protein IAD21_02111 [Abditibacteriota bacterium]
MLWDSLHNGPNFFIIGAAKSGTTRLHYLLGQHPEVFTSSYKEPGFFSCATPSPEQIEHYIELFRATDDAKAIGESSTRYSRCKRWPGTAERIFDFNSEARIIFIARHPLRRIESCWIQGRSTYNATPANFCESVRSGVIDSVDSTLYWKQLSEYRRYFPDEQILLLFFEEFIQDEPATLQRCFEFLGVDANVVVDCSRREQQNSFIGKQEAKPALNFLRQMPIYPRLQRLIPQALRAQVRPKLLRTITSRPNWDEATLQWTREQLREDISQFLAHAGKPANFWDWDSEVSTQ